MYGLIILSLLAVSVNSARILAMYPIPSLSHQVVFRPLMLELARRGHEVVVITTDVISQEEVPPNYTQVDVHDISYTYWRESVVPNIDGSRDWWKSMRVALKAFRNICDLQFRSEAVHRLLHSGQHFDLVFAEAFAQPAYVLSHIFKTPLILFSSMGLDYFTATALGVPLNLFIYPDQMSQRAYNLTLYEKISELYNHLQYRRMLWEQQSAYEEIMLGIFGPKTPSIDELNKNVDMLFLGVSAIWEDNRPVPPSVVYTGGLHIKPPKELPLELKAYLDNSKHGVIYVSFGTNVDPTQLAPERISVLCNVFSKLPYDVLWKWNGNELPGKPQNVRISKWLPQQDLLTHAKVMLFITQGGLQSTDEAIAAGVPLIALPMLGDQWYNAEKYEHFRIGKKLLFETVTEEDLERAIKEVIGDKKYQENIGRIATLQRDQPEQPLQRALWWTEYVLRHGGAKHLRSPLANVSWAEYLCLDLLLVLLCSTFLASLFFGILLYYTVRILKRALSQFVKQKVA